MIIKFIVEIEVEDTVTKEESVKQANEFDTYLSEMEDILARNGYDIYDQEWVAVS